MIQFLSQKRSILWVALALCLVAVATLIAGYRAQRGAAEQVGALAQRQGFEIEYSTVSNYPFATVLRNVKVRPKQLSFAAVTLDALTVRTSLTGTRRIVVEGCHVVLSGEPSSIFDGLLAQSKSQLGELTWGRIDVEYAQRVFGKLSLDDVRLERKGETLVVRVGEAKLGAARWRDVLFSLQRRNQMIEVGLANESPSEAETQLGYFPSNRGHSQWTLSLKHQPVRPVAESLGWSLSDEFDATRVAGTLSFVVHQDRARPVRGLLQLVIDRWARPNWPDGEAFLGNTASFLARIVPSEDSSFWDLVHVDVSLSIFSMLGSGRVSFGEKPSLAFDVRGTRTCAQIQGNTAPSSHLDRVNAYLDASADESAKRRAESAAMRLQIFADRASDERNVAWQLEPSCGLAELREGDFLDLQLPPREETVKR